MIGVSGKGDAAWTALTAALGQTDPACADQERFTLDPGELAESELIEMRRTCLSCPLLVECRAFAKITRPTGGFWAGRHYPLRHSPQDLRERREADALADEPAAREAPQPRGLNRTAERVSEPRSTIDSPADGRTALAASTRGTI